MELNEEVVEKSLDWLDSLVENSNDSDMAMFTYQLLGILYDTCEELTKENARLSFFTEQEAEAVRREAISKYKKSIIDYYNNDSRYDRPNAHTLLIRLFALLDEKAKELLEGEK